MQVKAGRKTPCNLRCSALHTLRHTALPERSAFFIEEKIEMINPAKFIREVRQESSKVTWPTRKETMVSTAMVLVMVMIAALFFLLVDNIAAWGVKQILGLGS